MSIERREFLKLLGLGVPGLLARPARAEARQASRLIVFYFPDGVVGPSQDGQPSPWTPTGGETNFRLGEQLAPLEPFRDRCVFFRGLSMGPTDSGSHPGGAKKLLTAVDGGNGESIDQRLARTAGARAPHRHLYLGVMANQNNASGDKHISYPSPGQSTAPIDDPALAFSRVFGAPGGGVQEPTEAERRKRSVLDGALAELSRFRARVGGAERRKLDLHLESLRELERRVLGMETEPPGPSAACAPLSLTQLGASELYRPERFPELLRLQIDLMVQAMACGRSQVGVVQCSVHTSELIMSRFSGTPMYDPGFDMRSHQASHYGNRHDPSRREYRDYLAQRRWWVSQFAYLLEALRSRPEGDGTMLDHSLVLLASEVSDGNTHLHDDMPFVLAGGGGGAIRTGRLLQFGYERHGRLFVALARAMGQGLARFGDAGQGPLPGLLA